MSKKRVYSLTALVIVMTISLCGCSKEKNDRKTEVISVSTEETTAGTTVETTETVTEASSESTSEQIKLPKAGVHSMDNLMLTAMLPVGNTMYIWGGGWNEADTGSGVEAVTIGVSERWAEFAAMQDESYDYNQTRYQIHDGLDCTGYIGWLVYNVVYDKNGSEEDGFVGYGDLSKQFSDYGFGTFKEKDEVTEWKPGDIMCMDTHIWMSLGMCEDNSVLLVHSSPPGVKISGTRLSDGSKSEAVYLAEEYMSKYYPDWYNKYPDCGVSYDYLTTASQMRWSESYLDDPNNIQDMTAREVMEFIFSNR